MIPVETNDNQKCLHRQPNIQDKFSDERSTVVHTENLIYHASTVEEPSSDPVPSFDKAAEVRLRWKIDLYVIPTVALLYALCFIDRVNIGNARLAGFEKDLGLQGYDYNVVLSIFYISYVVFEIPSNMACKWIGPGWFLPGISLIFGILTVCFAFVRTLKTACGVRFLLGVFESGLLPGVAYYLSRWYRRSELAFRLSLYIVMGPLSGAFSGLLASGILRLDHFGSTRGWAMICKQTFAIEGIVTIGCSLLAFVTLTDRPSTARWLTSEEKALAIERIKSERVDATTADVLDPFDRSKIIRGILNPVTLLTSWILLLINITVQGISFFTPTVVRSIYPNNSVISQQLYSVPPFVVGAVFTLLFCGCAWRYDRRNVIMLIGAVITAVGYAMFLGSSSSASSLRYGATFVGAAGSFAFGALCNAQVSANVNSDTARSSAIGYNVMMGNIGGLVATWSYLPFDAPDFKIGNGLNLGAAGVIVLVTIGLEVWMRRDNKLREVISAKGDGEAVLRGLTAREVQDLEWRHPRFRWRL